MTEYQNQAIAKLEDELKSIPGGASRYVIAIKNETSEALKSFCRQDEEFAQAIVQSSKTLTDCLNKITTGIGSSCSDIELYRRAVQFYFPGADIRMEMRIMLCPEENEPDSGSSGIILNLSDFL